MAAFPLHVAEHLEILELKLRREFGAQPSREELIALLEAVILERKVKSVREWGRGFYTDALLAALEYLRNPPPKEKPVAAKPKTMLELYPDA